MKKKATFLGAIVLLIIAIYSLTYKKEIAVDKPNNNKVAVKDFLMDISVISNKSDLVISLDNKVLNFNNEEKPYISSKAKVMFPLSKISDSFNCGAHYYGDNQIIIEKNNSTFIYKFDSAIAEFNGTSVDTGEVIEEINGQIYLPVETMLEKLNYNVTWLSNSNAVKIVTLDYTEELPEKYDLREKGRTSQVRDQGRFGTCWAFASLGALESVTMPKEKLQYSPDHMSINNSYNLGQNEGGEYTMAIAYLASWQGPVLESDDPYGDGYSPKNVSVAKHLEEAIILQPKDYDGIKEAIIKYGGVESSIFTYLTGSSSTSIYYNKDESAYYYEGDKEPNHDIVIVGWDDNFPKERFASIPEGDGAFICKNSWGTDFGENGYFYISYYDSLIGTNNVVYSKVASNNNYDKIYQSDMLGWTGQLGYNNDSAYFANVYQTSGKEELKAVGFYATNKSTTYKVYIVKKYENSDSLNERELITTGYFDQAGYYTVKLNQGIELDENSKYAIVVFISTSGAERPVAIEYNVNQNRGSVYIGDGEGYISLYGEKWSNTEESQNCNVCLKAFTNIVKDDGEEDGK